MKRSPRPTLRDVAAAAGVGVSTASYVLNRTGWHKVSVETRERIFAAARRIDYTANYAARGLRNGKTLLVGAVIPSIAFSFMPEILQGIEDVLNEHGYNMILCSYHTPEDFAERCAILSRKQVDGVIVRPTSAACQAILEDSFVDRLPCMMLATPSGRLPGVCVEPEAIGRLGGRYLADKGHRAILGYQDPGLRERDRGLFAYFAQAGLDTSGLRSVDAREVGVEELLDRYVLDGRPRPTAVHCGGTVAPEVLLAARARGLRVPEDLSILASDGYAYDAYTAPPLSSVEQPRHEQGAVTARRLMDWILHPYETPSGIIMEPTLRERASVAQRDPV